MIRDRAPKARLSHGTKLLGDRLLIDLFADPSALMRALIEGGFVVAGDADGSSFFALTATTGPMYRIFTDDEIDTWRAWIASLDTVVAAPPHAETSPTTVADRMQQLLGDMRQRQRRSVAHTGPKLTGDDPGSPGQVRKEPVSWWFEQPAPAFMAALARPDNAWVVPGDACASRLVPLLTRSNSAMARALAAPTPDGSSGVSVITEWIDARCPLPDSLPAVRPITLLSPADRVAAHPTGQIHRAGSVH